MAIRIAVEFVAHVTSNGPSLDAGGVVVTKCSDIIGYSWIPSGCAR